MGPATLTFQEHEKFGVEGDGMQNGSMDVRDRKLIGHPKGLFLVSGVELWERFSYYGMLGLLVLFLTANAGTGGFNWPETTALKLMGVYTGIAFAAPAAGGWISNRFLGERRCILAGGLLVAAGHLLLGGPAYLPPLIDGLSGENTTALLRTPGLSYADFFRSEASLAAMLTDAGSTVTDASWALLSYHLKLWSFLLGLALILIGTGLIKPTVSSIINHLYAPGDKARQTGFTIFMVSIYIGSLSANFIAGTLGETVGWHAGFTAATVGMLIGVAAYLGGQNAYLGNLGLTPQNPRPATGGTRPALTREHKRRIALILLMGAFTVLYAVAFYQKGGLLNLYAKQNIDRTVLGFQIPATWFLTISTGTFVLLAPLVISRLGRWRPDLDAIGKLAAGLALIACGYLLLSVAEFRGGDAEGGISALWLVLTYVFFGLGDIFVWPAQIAAAAALAPKHLVSLIVGAWYLTIGLGSWFTGYVGALAHTYSHLTVFLGLAITCLAAAALLRLMRKRASRLAHGIALS